MSLTYDCKLYGILDLGYVAPEHTIPTAKQLINGGVRILQLRAKNVEETTVFSLAQQLAPLCKELGCLFIVNDYPHIAKACNADGVHVGQDEPNFSTVRSFMGADKLIGRSTHSIEQARAAHEEGADYIGFGPLFPTGTKPGRPAIGLEDIASVHNMLPQDFPIFCIGGINKKTLSSVLEAGARRIVIVSDLLTANDITQRTQDIITILNSNG